MVSNTGEFYQIFKDQIVPQKECSTNCSRALKRKLPNSFYSVLIPKPLKDSRKRTTEQITNIDAKILDKILVISH